MGDPLNVFNPWVTHYTHLTYGCSVATLNKVFRFFYFILFVGLSKLRMFKQNITFCLMTLMPDYTVLFTVLRVHIAFRKDLEQLKLFFLII